MPGTALGLRAATPCRALYINRDQDEGRRQLIEGQLARAGLEGSRVAAVDGYNLPPDLAPYFAHVVSGQAPIVSAGEVGCYASHLKVYKQIVSEQAAATLVLEDDAVLDPRLPQMLRETLAGLPPGWDLVHLSKAHRRRAERPLASLPCGRTLVRYSRIPATTAGYLISRSGAAKMLNQSIPRFWPIDTDIRRAWVFDLDVYGLSAPPITQSESIPSVIGCAAHAGRGSERRGLPRPTAYSWSNAPLRTPRSFLFNVRKLGIGWWLRCFATNCARKLKATGTPLGRLASSALPGFRRA